VSNSLKYAFSGLSCGEISIQLHTNPGSDEYQLIVQDNGSGFPTDLDFRNTRSLGLQLVCNLTKQLQGTITLDRSAGTRFTISFAEPKPRG
jgi:two-component sensor histidine kinase